MDKNNEPPSLNELAMFFVARLFDAAEMVIRYGCIPFFFWLTVRELAGQKTVVDVVITYFSKGENIFPWGLAGASSIWAYLERKLRQTKIAKMSAHLDELEKRLDPNRTSSGLTATGQTPRRGGRFINQENNHD